MLIATLPPVYRDALMREMFANENVTELRYNTGMVSPYSAKETLQKILAIGEPSKKTLWIDLKGRQLRITEWARPDYAKIVLNHNVVVEGEAWAVFRDGVSCEIRFAKDNAIYLDGAPKEALGAGQSLNIHGEHVEIEGYLTDSDLEYIAAARELGLSCFMLSFVETVEDIAEAIAAFGSEKDLKLGLKIESQKGIGFVKELVRLPKNCELVAARDDLYINIGEDKTVIIEALGAIAGKCPDPIVASRIFQGLESDGRVSLCDICDLELMRRLGFRRFMLSDGLCQRHFGQAVMEWQRFASRSLVTE